MEKLLKIYQKRLTALHAKNRNLFLPRLYAGHYLDIEELNYELAADKKELIDYLIGQNKKPLCILKQTDSRSRFNNLLSKKINELSKNLHQIEEESGAYDLQVGYLFVEGQLLNGMPIRCPLVFFPVRLKRVLDRWYLEKREEVGIFFNKVFLQAYALFNQHKFEEDFYEGTLDAFEPDKVSFLVKIHQTLQANFLELRFQTQNFTKQLAPFQTTTVQDFLLHSQLGQLNLTPKAVLGIFPPSDSQIATDYDFLLAQAPDFTLEKHFERATPPTTTKALFAPFSLDSWQEDALLKIKNGNSLLVEGPPGTGKSQLIANMIADALAEDKKILLVCQKKAALDVVYNRLKEKDLHHFMAKIHDFKQDRNNLFGEIAEQIKNIEQYQIENNSLNTIQLERLYSDIEKEIIEINSELENLKKGLFSEKEFGISAKDLYGWFAQNKVRYPFSLPFEVDDFLWNKENFNLFLKQLREISFHFPKPPTSEVIFEFIQKRKLLGIENEKNLHKVETLLSDFFTIYQALVVSSERLKIKIFKNNIKETNFDKIKENFDFLVKIEAVLKGNPSHQNIFEQLKKSAPKIEKIQTYIQYLTNLSQKKIEWHLPQIQDYPTPIELQKFQKQHQNIFLKISSLLFRNDIEKKKLRLAKELIEKNKLKKYDFLTLKVIISNRTKFEKKLAQFYKLAQKWQAPNFDLKSPNLLIENLQNWIEKIKYIQELHQEATRQKLAFQVSFEETYQAYQNILNLIQQFEQKKQILQLYFTEAQLEILCQNPLERDKIWSYWVENWEALHQTDKILALFSKQELNLFESFFSYLKFDFESYAPLLTHFFHARWLAFLEMQYPLLKSVSTKKVLFLEEKLQSLILEKQKIAHQIIIIKNRERIYKNNSYNRLGNRLSYRDLLHQSQKKRQIWSIRKLIKHFKKEIFKLKPCWLASPETVSAIFEMETTFDLVIFDEASQCFAEKGLPSIYRGKQVVVVGDEQQLSPYDLYAVRAEETADNEEDSPALSVVSLLDLAKQYLSKVALRGHYRSHLSELIDFSNQHFYQNKLQVLPSFQDFMQYEPPIVVEKVEGIWEEGSNAEEAVAVVNLLTRLIEKGKKDIGIINFNIKQKKCIETEIEARNLVLPTSIFIKNIENVQGDEREYIIFSIGYAPNREGKLQAKFGSLNLQGGEKRLNVAITRAKKKIYVVTSILPQQLKVEQTANLGAKLLKSYLEYAYQVSNYEYRSKLPFEVREDLPLFRLRQQWATHFPFQADLPFSDLALFSKSNQVFKLIRTDDEKYHDLSSKAFHAYLPLLWQAKGWESEMLWSRNYALLFEKEYEKIATWFQV
ncbi:DEAD/DEAH box helicase [Hugenholtzia roseola]|uniref:DEAD/DEAH box helicase n=1 Tax=Hugenholtzia roseola TaxID=1002 RepID=UPI000405201A|nr:ATP-binding protein [Hugenholtzia roseola]